MCDSCPQADDISRSYFQGHSISLQISFSVLSGWIYLEYVWLGNSAELEILGAKSPEPALPILEMSLHLSEVSFLH